MAKINDIDNDYNKLYEQYYNLKGGYIVTGRATGLNMNGEKYTSNKGVKVIVKTNINGKHAAEKKVSVCCKCNKLIKTETGMRMHYKICKK